MQDRYVGDVGDFMKLGLLRWLAAPALGAPPHRLGVVWYRVADEGHNADGKHVHYLDPATAAGQDLRPLDPDLYDRLRALVSSGNRSVAALCESGALPLGTKWFDRVLSFDDLAVRNRQARIVRRERWFHEAMVAVRDCSLVFLDPDNGVRRDDHSVPSHRNRAEKHVYLSEVGRLLDRGQSVVVYHHADRSAPVPVQAESRMSDVEEALGVQPLAAVRASRGSTRLFIVVPSAVHRATLEASLGALQQSHWRDELRLYRPYRSPAFA